MCRVLRVLASLALCRKRHKKESWAALFFSLEPATTAATAASTLTTTNTSTSAITIGIIHPKSPDTRGDLDHLAGEHHSSFPSTTSDYYQQLGLPTYGPTTITTTTTEYYYHILPTRARYLLLPSHLSLTPPACSPPPQKKSVYCTRAASYFCWFLFWILLLADSK